jgi:NTP pyrophosphatase (non-canonical NTP hydrolase)
MLKIQDYQEFTRTTAIYPKDQALVYLGLGLASEGGEVAGVIKKAIRDNLSEEEVKELLVKELGDVCWYLARLADELGLSWEEILIKNMEKLTARKENNTLQGFGDHR